MVVLPPDTHRAGLTLDGRIAIVIEPDLVLLTGRGLWSPDHVDTHFAELKHLVEHERRRRGSVHFLLDLRLASIQIAETIDRILAWSHEIYRIQDRVAIIVASRRMRAEVRRNSAFPNHAYVLSEWAGRAWLRMD